MAELYYGNKESILLESKPVTVGTERGCTLTLDRGLDELTEAIAAASAAAAAAAVKLGPMAPGILVEEGGAEVDPPMRYFVIQPHETGHILKTLAHDGVVKVNGKSTVIHQLVDGDEITAEDHKLEYSNSAMPHGIWEHLEKKRGARSVRWLLPVVGVVALVIFGFYQWVVYAGRKHDEMQNSLAQTAPISNEAAQAILTDISKTSEERLAEMGPDDLRRVREEFLLSEDATEEEKAANLEALGKMFGVETSDLLEGGNAADILAMVDGSEGGRLQYKSEIIAEMDDTEKAIAMERLAAMERFIVEQREFVISERRAVVDAMIGRILDGEAAPSRGGTRKFELKLEGMESGDVELLNRAKAKLASVALGRISITELPAVELAALRIHETDAVTSYIHHGHRDAAWDVPTVTAIQIDARLRVLKSIHNRNAAWELLTEMSKAALEAGCGDPHLLLIRERLVAERGIELPYEGCGTPLENAVLMVERLDVYPPSPFLRSRIYRHGVEVALKFAHDEGLPKLKGMSFDCYVDMPITVAKDWNRWIDLGVAGVVAGAPQLTSTNVRHAYAEEVRNAFVTYSRARGERESVARSLGLLANLDGGDKVLSSLTKIGTRRR